MSSAWLTSFEKEHLWMYLQALGFEPGPATAACGKIESHTHLGVNMFDKLNRDAFQIVSYFLFQTLDPSLTKEVFKHCWPPFDHKRDAEFRKHCCEWLKKISAECGSSFPPVVGSLFISPGGSKFIHLMYHFAKFVAVKYIKSSSKNSSTHFVEVFNVKSQDLQKCIARCHVARNRFLHILQKEDCISRKYQENAQLAVEQIRSLREECIAQQNQIKNMEPFDEQINIQEKIEKVRSLWATVTETLEYLDKEKEIVSSVLSLVDHYVLDGANVTVNIPDLLIDKIEKQMSQLHIGNIYESGKLNFVTVIQLLNEVLKVMKHECCQPDQARLKIDLHFLEKETRFQRERLSDLKQTRHKIKEDLTTIRHSIVEKQGEWHKKWKEILGRSPFSLIQGSTSAMNLLPPMSPLSFDPASEEVYAKSILTQYPALLRDTPLHDNQESDCTTASQILETVCDVANSSASFVHPTSSADKNNITLLEKNTKISIPGEKHEDISKKRSEFEEEDSLSKTAKTVESGASGGPVPAKTWDPFQKEQDHLVDEVARAVLSDSPQFSEGKGIRLEELIDSLVSNPFLTRKQIPRTPENLISDIRSSWRKAVEMENNGTTESIQQDTEQHGEILPESSPVLHDPREFSMASFFSATSVSNTNQSNLLEEKVVSDYLQSIPQKQVTGCISQSATPDASDLLTKKNLGKQDLKCTVSQNKLLGTSQIQPFSPAVGSEIELTSNSEEENVKMLDCSQAYQETSRHKAMLWNSFQLSSGFSSSLRDTDFGILHETFPEEMGRLSLNSSSTTETSFKLDPNSSMPSSVFPEDAVGERQTTLESDFCFPSTCSRDVAVKKSLSKKREETNLSTLEIFERHKLELSPTPLNIQTGDRPDILDSKDLHIAYTKPLRLSLGERKRSLSPLIKFSPVEQRWRPTIPCSLDDLPNLAEEDIQNKNPDEENSHRTY